MIPFTIKPKDNMTLTYLVLGVDEQKQLYLIAKTDGDFELAGLAELVEKYKFGGLLNPCLEYTTANAKPEEKAGFHPQCQRKI